MSRLLSIGIECFSSIVFVIPVVIILQYFLFKNQDFGKIFMVFIFAFYSMAVFSAVGIPIVYDIKVSFTFNLIPFIAISSIEYIKNTILNIILFMPMGFLLPVIWKEYRTIKKTLFMGFAVSIIIELLQIFTFRLTDIDDLITNTLGTLLGYYLGKLFLSKFPLKILENSKNISMKYEPVIILISIFLIAFFIQPLMSNKIWNVILSSPLWESIK